jgi:glycosyltransferase involved in cell wall biosynthesis
MLHVVSVNRKSRIDLIHAQDTAYGGLAAIISAKILRIPVIISSHGIRYFTLKEVVKGCSRLFLPFEYWLDAATVKNSNLVVTVSSQSRDFFSRFVSANKIIVIPVGIETVLFEESKEVRKASRKSLNITGKYIAIGFVGRLSTEKNLFTLLEAFSKALDYNDKMKLVIIGAGPLKTKLDLFSRDKGFNDKIIFTGVRQDVNRLLSALDIFVLPSYTEGCPTSMLEAMAAGKAIIASDIASIREIVKNGEAILVNPNDVDGFKKAIVHLYRDANLRESLGREAKETSKIYEAGEIYSRILKTYKELTASKKEYTLIQSPMRVSTTGKTANCEC